MAYCPPPPDRPAVGPVARVGTHRRPMVEQSELDIGSGPAAFCVSKPLVSCVTDASGDGGQQIDIRRVGVGGWEEGTPSAAIETGDGHRTLDADHREEQLGVRAWPCAQAEICDGRPRARQRAAYPKHERHKPNWDADGWLYAPPLLVPLGPFGTDRGKRRLASFYDPAPNSRRVAAAALPNQPASVPGATMSQPAATRGFA